MANGCIGIGCMLRGGGTLLFLPHISAEHEQECLLNRASFHLLLDLQERANKGKNSNKILEEKEANWDGVTAMTHCATRKLRSD